MDEEFHPTIYNGYVYLSMLGLKLIHVKMPSTPKPPPTRPGEVASILKVSPCLFKNISSEKMCSIRCPYGVHIIGDCPKNVIKYVAIDSIQ